MTIGQPSSDSVAVPITDDELRVPNRLNVRPSTPVSDDALSNASSRKETKKKNKKQKDTTPKKKKEKVAAPQPKGSRKKRCATCCKQFTAFLFSTVGLSCLMVGYTVLGGFIFMKVEAPYEVELKNNVLMTRHEHAKLLWNLTLDLNVFFPDNWTAMAEQVLETYAREIYVAIKQKGWDGKDGPQELQWTFAGSLLYSITVITTIGYGHIAPKTNLGRIATILYAIVGIPLTLLTITNLGGYMATAFRLLYKNVCCGLCCCNCCRKPDRKKAMSTKGVRYKDPALKYKDPQNGDAGAARALTAEDSHDDVCPHQRDIQKQLQQQIDNSSKLDMELHWKDGVQTVTPAAQVQKDMDIITPDTKQPQKIYVPMYISLLLIAAYIMSGALLFTIWEKDWDYLIGSYFCFITLTTIGFGDYVPGTSMDTWGSQEKLVLCALYLLFGLALIAMCFDLMQEEARNIARNIGRKIGLIK